MNYALSFGLGVVCLAAAVVLDAKHVGEENSLLVFGPALLGLSAIFSPLILNWAFPRAPEDRLPVRPSGRAVIQSLLFPLIGAAFTVWGVLGATGVVGRVSFDGPQQHCRTCATNWILSGARGGRPHYVEACERCVATPGLLDEVAGMGTELAALLAPPPHPAAARTRVEGEADPEVEFLGEEPQPEVKRRPVRYSLELVNRSALRIEASGMEERIREACRGVLEFTSDWGATPALRLEVEGEKQSGTGSDYRLRFRLSLREPDQETAAFSVERALTVATEPQPR
ncbi:MAG: hypothetical protein HZA54_21150 [Planctomycetes bacterium]|nr:hypothetical protein [Planctomycetota bacterium]